MGNDFPNLAVRLESSNAPTRCQVTHLGTEKIDLWISNDNAYVSFLQFNPGMGQSFRLRRVS